MAMPHVEENNASRRRLTRLVQGLSDEQLSLTTDYGWTVASLLAHLAFWDQRVLALLRRWKEKGVDLSPIDADAVNEALKPLCLALPPRAAADLCLVSAESVDTELERVSPDLLEAVQATPNQFRVRRSLHRNDHLDDIEMLIRLHSS
jgi:hypothetical protein